MSTIIALPWTAAPLTQNGLRRMHYQVEARLKKTAMGEVYGCIARAEIEPMTGAIVTLHYRPGTKRRLDSDGLAPTLKVCLDAAVHAGVLPDDSAAYVPEVRIRVHKPIAGKAGCLWVEFEPLEVAA